MTQSLREPIAGVAALFAGILAAFTLMPTAGNSTALGDLDTWTSLQANAIALGALSAVPTTVLLARSGSRRVAWAAAGTCAAVVGLTTLTPADADAWYYVRAVAAGGLVGAAVTAAWGKRAPQLGFVLGFTITFLGTWMRDATPFRDLSKVAGASPLWLVAATVVGAVTAAAFARRGFRSPRPRAGTIRVALVGVLAFVVVNRVFGGWLTDNADAPRLRVWLIAIAALATVLAVVGVVAALAPETGGRFVLATTAVTAAAVPVANSVHADFGRSVELWVALAAGAVAVLLGLRIAGAAPHRVAGLAIVAVVPICAAVWPQFGTDDSWIVFRAAMLGLGAGHAIGSNLPAESPFAAFGFVVPPGAYALSAVFGVPLTGTGGDPTRFDDNLVALLMLAVVMCCAAAISVLRTRRDKPGPAGSADTQPAGFPSDRDLSTGAL